MYFVASAVTAVNAVASNIVYACVEFVRYRNCCDGLSGMLPISSGPPKWGCDVQAISVKTVIVATPGVRLSLASR